MYPRTSITSLLAIATLSLTTHAVGADLDTLTQEIDRYGSYQKFATAGRSLRSKTTMDTSFEKKMSTIVDDIATTWASSAQRDAVETTIADHLTSKGDARWTDRFARDLVTRLDARGLEAPSLHVRASRAYAATTAFETFARVTINSGTLNVRAEPSTNSAVITTLQKDELILIRNDYQQGWYEVDVYGEYGYVSRDFVKPRPLAAVTTVETTLNLRSGPSKDYPVVGSLRAEQWVDLIGQTFDTENNMWYKIKSPGVDAFASADYFSIPEINE